MARSLKLVATLVVLVILVIKASSTGSLTAAVGSIGIGTVAIVCGIFTLDRLLMTYKWLRLLRHRGFSIPLLVGMQVYCASMVWGLFLPSSVGADAIRAVSISRLNVPLSEATASIAIERLIGVAVTALFAAASLIVLAHLDLLDARLGFVWWASAVMAFCAALLFFACTHRGTYSILTKLIPRRLNRQKLLKLVSTFHEAFTAHRRAPRELVSFATLTAVEQLFGVCATWVIAAAMGLDVEFTMLAAAVLLSFFFSRIPISLGGIGVYEGVFVLITSSAGVSIAEGAAIALVMRAVQIATWIPWWLAFSGNISKRLDRRTLRASKPTPV